MKRVSSNEEGSIRELTDISPLATKMRTKKKEVDFTLHYSIELPPKLPPPQMEQTSLGRLLPLLLPH
jgi:hypothetical protein